MPIREEHEKLKKIPFAASKIENIDAAMVSYVENLALHATTNSGWKQVPVIWTSSERSFQSKRDSRVRDEKGSLVLPIITIERTSIVKDPSRKGTIQANIVPKFDEKGGSIVVARRIKQDKTSNFANSHAKQKRGQINFPTANEKIVYETISIPLPVYITVNYEITIRTEYQQQMNELTLPFVTSPGGINYILIEDEKHRYEGFIQQDFSHDNNLSSFTSEERKFETKLNVEVLGHVFDGGDRKNVITRENAVELKIPRERIMTNDEVESEIGDLYGLSGFDDV